MHQKLAEKYFNKQTTPDESQMVLEWFETSAGRQFLQEMFEKDRGLLERKDLRSTGFDSELDSEKLFSAIQEVIRKKKKKFTLKKTDWLGYSMKVAAAVLVIIIASLFTIIHENYAVDQITKQETVIFHTDEEQHREITLSYGSIIRLNEKSEIVISEDFFGEKREIRLKGEAYFDVAHNPEKPFIINTSHSTIEVLGTAFNVREVAGQSNVQVAVVDGMVSFSAAGVGHPERPSVVLSKGQFGYLNVKDKTLKVDEVAIDNYITWKSGRFVFDELTLEEVCTQLNRLYNLACIFESQELSKLNLTSNFSNESVDKTLSVIALSLQIDFKKEEDRVYWSPDHPNETLLN